MNVVRDLYMFGYVILDLYILRFILNIFILALNELLK